MPVTVLALVKSKPGFEKQVRENLIQQVEPTRKEDGCINYDLHQSENDPTEFMFYENWDSHSALAAHAASGHISLSREKNKELLDRPTQITIWEAL